MAVAPSRASWWRRPSLAGGILAVMGALWALIGAVLIVLAWLYGDPASLPDWVELDPAAATSPPLGIALVGVAVLAGGVGQVIAGYAVQRRTHGWPPLLGAALGIIGLVVVGGWLVSGLAGGRPVLVLIAPLAAYAYAAAVLVTQALEGP
jgi:hypothetical protein